MPPRGLRPQEPRSKDQLRRSGRPMMPSRIRRRPLAQSLGASARTSLEPPQFGGAHIPLTAQLAQAAADWLRQQLRDVPIEWPFEDRVIAWLLPSLRRDIEVFHHAGGPDITEIFQQHQLAHLDADLYRQLRLMVLRAAKEDR